MSVFQLPKHILYVQVRIEDGSLKLKNIDRRDEGNYTCLVESDADSMVYEFYLKVQKGKYNFFY